MILYKNELFDCATEEEAQALIDLRNNPPALTAEEIAEDQLLCLRIHRNKLLSETDWWAVGDRTMTQEQTDYRQALRDITDTYSSLEDVVWPDKPEI